MIALIICYYILIPGQVTNALHLRLSNKKHSSLHCNYFQNDIDWMVLTFLSISSFFNLFFRFFVTIPSTPIITGKTTTIPFHKLICSQAGENTSFQILSLAYQNISLSDILPSLLLADPVFLFWLADLFEALENFKCFFLKENLWFCIYHLSVCHLYNFQWITFWHLVMPTLIVILYQLAYLFDCFTLLLLLFPWLSIVYTFSFQVPN